MPRTRKMKWGGLLIAGLALAASLIVAPLGAYAADVPTPELKDSYVLDNSFYVGHSPSGRYVLYVDESTGKTCLLDAKDGSHVEVANVKDNMVIIMICLFVFQPKRTSSTASITQIIP